MRIVEFYIPRELGDLEKKPDDQSECTRYFVECVMDVSQMSESEQVSTLQAILNEMGTARGSAKGSGPIGIFDSSKFDALYSYIKNTEHLTRESKFMLGNELPQLLKKLCKQVVHILSRREAGTVDTGDRSPSPSLEIDKDFDIIARSALKMYCFLICNLILRVEFPPAQSNSGNLTGESNPQQFRSRQKSRGTNVLGVNGETLCMDLSAKELALTALLDMLSSDLDQIWSKSLQSTGGAVPLLPCNIFETSLAEQSGNAPHKGHIRDRRAQVDDAVLQIIFNIVLRMMTSKGNLFESANNSSRKEDLTAVGHGIHMLLLAIGHRLVTSHDLSTDAQFFEESLSQMGDHQMYDRTSQSMNLESRKNLAKTYFRQCSVTPSMKEDFLSPVGELVIKYEFVAKYIALFIQTMNLESLQQDAKNPGNVSAGENQERVDMATSDRQHTGSSSPVEKNWPIRLVRGIFETVTEYCGIVPDIVEDTASEKEEDNQTLDRVGGEETVDATEDSNEIPVTEPSTTAQASSVEINQKPKSWKIVYLASSNLTVDAGSCKNLVAFFDVLTEGSVAIIAQNFDLLKPLLTNCENYDVRKSIVSSLVEIIQEKFSKVSRLKGQLSKNSADQLSQEMETYKHECQSYVEHLNMLLARLMDVSSVVRTHSIKGFSKLWEKKVMPLPYQLKLLERVVLRLDDRNNHTRKAAFVFVSTAISNNSFTSKYLSLKRLQSKKGLIEKQMEAVDDSAIDDGNDATMTAFGVSGDISSPTHSRSESSNIGMNEFSSMVQENSVLEEGDGELGRQDGSIESLSQKRLKIKFYKLGIRFVESIHRAIEIAFVMLRSRVLADVLESIELIAKANELRVDAATKDSYKMFPLIYSDEVAVQEAIRSAFGNMLFVQFRKQTNIPLVYRNIACIKNFMHLLANCEEEIIAAIESICEHLASQKNMQPVITDDILSVIWGITNGETVLMKGGMANQKEREEMGLVDGELSELRERRYAMQLYSILVLAHPRHVKERIPEIVQKLLPEWSSDNIMCCYLFRSLQRLTAVKSFSLLSVSDPLMDLVAQQIVRPSESLEAWMMMAERGLSLISSLCDTPSETLEHIMRTVESYMLNALPESLSEWLFNQEHGTATALISLTDEETRRVGVALTQFVFLLGHCVLKQYIYIDNWERSALSHLEMGNEYRPLYRQGASTKIQPKETKKKVDVTDTMEKELGFDSKEYKREEIREIAENGREGLAAPGSTTQKYMSSLIKWISYILQHSSASLTEQENDSGIIDSTVRIMTNPSWRTACILTLEKLMIVNESVCKQNIRLLFTILKQCPEWWIRTNCLVGMGDLLCTHPNVVQPYLHPSEGHTTTLLDPSTDPRVRYTAVTLYIHLALNDMLRIPEMTPYLLSLIGDDDVAIAKLGVNFLHELHSKNKNMVYNLLPVVCMHMCKVYENNEEKFFDSIRIIMEKIEKDKQAEAIVDKLCSKYPTFSAHGTTHFDLVVARYLTFCLSELNYANDRVVLKLCSEANFQYYKRWMADSQVRRFFAHITTKVRRSGHGSTTVDVDKSAPSGSQGVSGTKVGSDRRSRVAMLEDWETRVKSFLQRNMESAGNENELETSTCIPDESHQLEPALREKRTRCVDSESDE
ncbi:condensin subunit 1 [Perkinsela sp. CCAP 1560/4]|nr:condensin subunit 1 [Perkinsela sp. CCAP 1560/4]|eukprot:KNH04670.1 condensin subunit 1 [Perkinsela sp. CCAP 1560/4]